jgi:hypothetical protein
VRGQRDGTDALDHRGTAPFFILLPHVAGCVAPPDIQL